MNIIHNGDKLIFIRKRLSTNQKLASISSFSNAETLMLDCLKAKAALMLMMKLRPWLILSGTG